MIGDWGFGALQQGIASNACQLCLHGFFSNPNNIVHVHTHIKANMAVHSFCVFSLQECSVYSFVGHNNEAKRFSIHSWLNTLSLAWKYDLSKAILTLETLLKKTVITDQHSPVNLKGFRIFPLKSEYLFWIPRDVSAALSFWHRGAAKHGENKIINPASLLHFYSGFSPQDWQLWPADLKPHDFWIFSVLWHIYHSSFTYIHQWLPHSGN